MLPIVVEEHKQRAAEHAEEMLWCDLVVRAVCDRVQCMAQLDEFGVAVLDLESWFGILAAIVVVAAAEEIPMLMRSEEELRGRDERQ